ncbi:hypothetical protein [Nonlabens dokdonensis]|uniref:hypothetical protein n=1 Tax=Nonlabens dokdonensis TaxID=328515 RepID=UPI0026F23F4D|nr:hypothetical protein [Nonlabens dokdonensis]
MAKKKIKIQQYFYLRSQVGSKLNRLETELDNYLYRHDRKVFNNQQELSRWLEGLSIQCKILNSCHSRSTPATVEKETESDSRLVYRLTSRLIVVIYKSNMD